MTQLLPQQSPGAGTGAATPTVLLSGEGSRCFIQEDYL